MRNLHSWMAYLLAMAILPACKKDTPDLSVKGITLAKANLSLKPGASETLFYTIFPSDAADQSVTWTSSDTLVAVVDNTGKVTGLKPGTSTVTLTAKSTSQTSACTVTVTRNDAVTVSGNVEGVWAKYTTVNVSGHIKVPAGKTLRVEEGVEVIVSTASQDANNTKIEWIVDGNLYIQGKPSDPVRITVPAAERTAANTFKRLWGGIIGSNNCSEMLIDYAIIEYTGAITTATSPSAVGGFFKSSGGEGMVAFNTNNPNGKYVIQNTVFRNTGEDAIYVQGGSCIFTNNTFHAVGDIGGDAINVKAGCKVDAAYNLIYSANTNAFKLSNSGASATRSQAVIYAYNNTILNAGWRRDPNKPKGGSIWGEAGALIYVYNNLVANSMFRTKAPKWGINATDGPDLNSKVDNNMYVSGPQTSTVPQHVTNRTVTAYDGFKPGVVDAVYGAKDVSGTAVGDKDPKFVNFPFATEPLLGFTFNPAWDFRLQAGSPAATGGKTDFTPQFASNGITVNGKLYKSPQPSTFFGAYNVK